MPKTLHPNLALGSVSPWMDGESTLQTKIRMILETRPGQMPWRPDFGCDLEGLIGQQANADTLVQIRFRVQNALQQWLPDVEVKDCNVELKRTNAGAEQFRHPEIPVGERALVGAGPQAIIRIDVDLITPDGLLTVSAEVD